MGITNGGENLLDKKMGTSLLLASAKASSPHGYQSTFTSYTDSVTNQKTHFLGNSRNSTQFNPIIPSILSQTLSEIQNYGKPTSNKPKKAIIPCLLPPFDQIVDKNKLNKNEDEPHLLGYEHAEEDRDCAQQLNDWCGCENAMQV